VSYWEITLSNVPSGYDVTNRTYVGWCCDETYTIYNGQTIDNMKLYSSYDPSQPWEANLTNWSKVNYIINHKQGTWDEVQAAIWHYIDHNGGNQADPTVIAMEAAADRNPNFVPSAGQLLAVVVYLAGEQSTFIEVVVPAQLTVISAYGSPDPSGTTSHTPGTSVTASVASPVGGPPGPWYVCTGWTGTGDVPASGTGTTVTFTITKDSTLTWNWKTVDYCPEPVILAVEPPTQEFVGPCIVSTTFTIDVYLWNDYVFTGTGVYAWDFNVTWNPTVGISLVSVTINYPTQTGANATAKANYFLIDSSFSNANGWYHLAETLMPTTTDPYPELLNLNASLVTLTFHIDDEPCYPWTLSTPFTISFQPSTGGLASGCKQPDIITDYELDPGEYSISAAKPDIHLTSPTSGYEGAPWYNITEGTVGKSIQIDVYLSNITHCYGFFVDLTWDNWYKITDVQSITIGPAFKLTDYAVESIVNMTGTGAPEMGELWITVIRPIEKPLICGENVLAFSIIFTTTCPNPIPTPTTLLPFAIKSAEVMCAPTLPSYLKGYGVVYGEPIYSTLPLWGGTDGISSVQPLIYSCNIKDYWMPKQGDVDYDGVVNVADLAMVAHDYGSSTSPYCTAYNPEWGPTSKTPVNGGYVGLTGVGWNGYVNIYDVAYVAKNFGN
jgi:hypothetical protein